jgi:hypothetical protein
MSIRSAVVALLTWWPALMQAANPQFSRDVLPILSEHCFSCHGPDEAHRKGRLRLDTREGALAQRQATAAAVPGQPDHSEMIRRIESQDPEELMPPPKSGRPLSPAQITTLREWIHEGASWGRHWAFEPPKRPVIPSPIDASPRWTSGNPIDRFIRAGLAAEGLQPAPPASKATRLRRVSFDLTGLPPSPGTLEAFERDTRPEAWSVAVDRLLASPHFGERMAMWWLDAARYADTDGYQADDTRTNWPWRDWVVAAFNENLPFDQFTLEQFAGDLLPGATPLQRLATAFHRNHMTNGEGGRDPEESRVDYVIDRVNTVGTVWLGLTLNCAQCHSHKYDPISHAEYYQLTAFFNSIDEDGKAGRGAKPYLSYESPQAVRAVNEAQNWLDHLQPIEAQARRDAEIPFHAWLKTQFDQVSKGYQTWTPLVPADLTAAEGTQLRSDSEGVIQATGPNPRQDDYRVYGTPRHSKVTGLRLDVLPHPDHTGGAYSRGESGEFILTDIKVQLRRRGRNQVRDIGIASAVADYSAEQKGDRAYGDIKGVLDDDPRNGWTTKGSPSNGVHTAVFALTEPLVLRNDDELIVELRQRSTLGDANIGRFRLSCSDQPGAAVRSMNPSPLDQLKSAGTISISELEPALRGLLFEQFLTEHPPYQRAHTAVQRASAHLEETRKAAGKLDVMVLAERTNSRPTHVLVRGVWDKPAEVVPRGVPRALSPFHADLPRTREGLARWIVARDNPLTARVIVNHLWQVCFGAGLVRTPEDFGLQGERPTHPDLLDWLAVEFMESGWDIKKLLRLMVTCDTYQQSSSTTAELQQRDPSNRWLARGSRFRLPSWMLRDGALQTAGLLNPALGGPPVKPYQPDGLWEENFMGRFKYDSSPGAAQYRRSLYAFWRRTIAPSFLFDSAQRRVCEVRTPRTNTPLQALALLNDENFLEAARALALQTHQRSGDTKTRLHWLARRILSRTPTDSETAILHREWDQALTYYSMNPTEAETFLARGQISLPVDRSQYPERAAWTLTASLILNLDEAMTHE